MTFALYTPVYSKSNIRQNMMKLKTQLRATVAMPVVDPGIPKRGCGTGGLGDGSPPARARSAAPVGVWGQDTDIMLNSQLTASENFNTKTYTTRQKQDKLSARN